MLWIKEGSLGEKPNILSYQHKRLNQCHYHEHNAEKLKPIKHSHRWKLKFCLESYALTGCEPAKMLAKCFMPNSVGIGLLTKKSIKANFQLALLSTVF